jgi:hypothetical protein
MVNDLRSSQNTPPNGQLNIFQTWLLALLPSEGNYARIVNDPNASLGRAYIWLLIAALVSGVISTLISAGFELVIGPSANPFLQSLGVGSVTGAALINELCLGVPLQSVLALIGLSVIAGLSHGLALALGGHGRFTQLFYAMAAYAVPLLLLEGVIASIPIVDLLVIVMAIYALALNVVAAKAVYQFGWGRAAVASISIPVLAVVLIACAAVVALALLGPALSNTLH